MTLSKEALFVLSIATVRVPPPFQYETEMVPRKILSRPLFKLDIEKPVHTGETKSTILIWVRRYLFE
jgi:hypothetical protein